MRATKQLVNGIRVYSRHSADCGREPAYVKCECPKWIQYQLGGKQIREAAGTRSFGQAAKFAERKAKELSGEAAPTPEKGVTIKEAVDKWLASRKQEEIQNVKARLMTDKLKTFCDEQGIVLISTITRAHLSAFKSTLPFKSGNSNSMRTHLSVLGGFFTWAVEEGGLLAANPFPKFNIKFKPKKVAPPDDEEIARVLANPSVRLFASLMRWSGMAIIDAATLKRSALVGNLITSSRTKTDKSFRVRIPMWLAKELHALPPVNATYFFWDGKMLAKSVTRHYRDLLRDAFEQAGVKMTPHKFRHYFISTELSTGTSAEDVSKMVGTSPAEVRKTYEHWIKDAMDRLDDVQALSWKRRGLDENGNPKV
jgi:integrase